VVSYHIDASAFERALEDYAAYSSRTIEEVLNAACLDVAIKAAQATPKASASKIASDLRQKVWVTSRDKDKRGRERSRARLIPLAVAIVASRDRKKGGTMNRQQIRDAARKLASARRRSAGYIAYAGWQKAVLAFGGRGFGSKGGELNPKGKAARGYGVRASVNRLEAELANLAVGAEAVGLGPLQAVLNAKAADLRARLQKKLNARRSLG